MLSDLNPLTILNPAASGQAVGSAIGKAVSAPVLGSGNPTLTKYIIIGLGALLVAAGLFSFDKTRELVVQGAKAVAA